MPELGGVIRWNRFVEAARRVSQMGERRRATRQEPACV